jgi:spore germination cell wall hydrolase CwlJ-like protein
MRRWLLALALALLPMPAPAAGPQLSYALECLALNVYWEAHASDATDQLAVAYVTLNRVRADGFPDSVCEVVHQGGERPRYGCQFHWWCDGRSDEPTNESRWQAALAAARAAMARTAPDPTHGAKWFHNHTVTPDWAGRKQRTAQTSGHFFYK